MYLTVKTIHMAFAAVTIAGFLFRGYWHFSDSAIRQHPATRVVPHVLDALFLASGIWLAVILNLNLLQHPWLLAKFVGLLGYIGFGMVAFRFGSTREVRLIAFVAAVAAFAYIVGAAVSKSPFSWLAS
jgi:uncharacterized membrane protein SirB2